MRALCGFAIVAHAACGRLSFDPRTDGPGGGGGGGGTVDASSTTDATQTTGGSCVQPVAISVGTTSIDTCLSADRVMGCRAGAPDVVVAFTPPTTNYYDVVASSQFVLATDLSATCGNGICTNSFGMNFLSSNTYYFIVEALSGGCAQGTVTVQ